MHKQTFSLAILVLVAITSLPSVAGANTASDPDRFNKVFHIPLRIHLGNSKREIQQWLPIFAEMNAIWLRQAKICFDIHTVPHDHIAEIGLDLWFEPTIPDWNGYFTDLHDIHVRDNPDLRPALNPARSSAARTAAHELGHALELDHRHDSDDNLMQSKTYGWQLNAYEIERARKTAIELASSISTTVQCNPPRLHNNR